jgi:hypothetical protein
MHHYAVSEFVDEAGFDLAIGRYVLVHQAVAAARAQIVAPEQYCAWARV